MIPYAAIDLRQGAVVQLVGGNPDVERVRLTNPGRIARQWERDGFRGLHVVDLDAAMGKGRNDAAIEEVLKDATAEVQVGGGVRDTDSVQQLLEMGASRVVVGTRAIIDRAWLEQLAERFPQRIVVAADSLAGEVAVRGWTAGAGVSVDSFVQSIEDLPIAAFLITDINREGRMEGINAGLFRRLCALTAHPVQASGGISTLADLNELEAAGASAAVLGMSLYTGAIDAAHLNREFGR